MEWGFACWTDGRLVGLVSCFPDWEKGNADCSLLLDAHGADYRAAAGALLAKAREKLGSGMACTFFFPVENGECRGFLEQAGARRQVNEYILRLGREAWSEPRDMAAEPRPVREGELADFAALHDQVFPGVYVSGRDILEDLGKGRFVYVVSDSAGLAAYGVLMYVQFIFVAIYIGYAVGAAPVISFHYGAENETELKNMFRKSMCLVGSASVVLTVLAFVLASPLSRIFVGYDEELFVLTRHAFHLFAFSFLIFCLFVCLVFVLFCFVFEMGSLIEPGAQ